MPAKSKAQQQAAGLALSCKRGEIPRSRLTSAARSMLKMSIKDLEEYAGTKHKAIPRKKK